MAAYTCACKVSTSLCTRTAAAVTSPAPGNGNAAFAGADDAASGAVDVIGSHASAGEWQLEVEVTPGGTHCFAWIQHMAKSAMQEQNDLEH